MIEWSLLSDAIDAYDYYEAGYLPEVFDDTSNKPCSILDQTEFFGVAHGIVKSARNQAENQQMERAKQESKTKK